MGIIDFLTSRLDEKAEREVELIGRDDAANGRPYCSFFEEGVSPEHTGNLRHLAEAYADGCIAGAAESFHLGNKK